ncbi:phosphoadenosine phosphosulfate reductase [Eubacterium callanderi]|uniref:phosphoadenosine phosphosulfate reductase n=1 Tax=Eubacterium callanderi TaxID=53442 RepID=UPI003991268B
MKVAWFSTGVSSFIACYLTTDIEKIMYCHIEDQHPDSMRFLSDCEKVLDKKINIIGSPYRNVENVIQQFRFINSPYGAKCTEILKRRVRKEWERQQNEPITYVWGYDVSEKHRAERMEESMPEFKHEFPLIENGLSKSDCHGLLCKLGVKRPKMYDLGYPNNCIGCIKGGMWYWNKIRKDFPEVFKRRAKQEREIGHSCINGVYLDELDPDRGKESEEILQDCSIMCLLLD